MKIAEQKITIRNLVNTIDRTVLNLRKVKKGEDFSQSLKNQITDIVVFILESKEDKFSDALFNKGVFIENETLQILHANLCESTFTKEELIDIKNTINGLENKNIEEINKIQSTLIKISIPIWETTQQLFHE